MTAGLSSPHLGHGPVLGNWDATVDYFRRRRRGYVLWNGGALRSITRSHPSVAVWPLRAEVTAAGLLAETFPGAAPERWCEPHSAWLCPEIPFEFQVGEPKTTSLAARQVATAADGC